MIRLSQGFVPAEPPATPLPVAGHPLPAPPPAHAPTPRGTRQYPDVTPSLIGVARHYPDVTPSLIGVARHYPDVTPRFEARTGGASRLEPGFHSTHCCCATTAPLRPLHHGWVEHAAPSVLRPAHATALMRGDATKHLREQQDALRQPCRIVTWSLNLLEGNEATQRDGLLFYELLLYALSSANAPPPEGNGPPVTTGWRMAEFRNIVWPELFVRILAERLIASGLTGWFHSEIAGSFPSIETFGQCIADGTRAWTDVYYSRDECEQAYGPDACNDFRYGTTWPVRHIYAYGANLTAAFAFPMLTCSYRHCSTGPTSLLPPVRP